MMPTVQGHGAVNWIFTVANPTLDNATLGFVLLIAANLAVFYEIFDIFWEREKSLQFALQEMVLFEKLVGLKLVHGILVCVDLGRYSEFHGLVNNFLAGSRVRDWASTAPVGLSFKT